MSDPPGSQDLSNTPPDSPESGANNTSERWDRVRRQFLPAHKIRSYPHPAQNIPSGSSSVVSTSGRSSPRHWDHSFGRLGARVFRYKPPLNLSEAQRFRDELFGVIDTQRNAHGKLHTYAPPSLMSRHRQNTSQNDTFNNNHSDSRNIASGLTFDILSKLAKVINKFNDSRNLPEFTTSFVLEQLSKPFNVFHAGLDSSLCSLALEIFEKICTEFQSNSEDETLQRWIWCCQVMYMESTEIRDRVSRLLLTLTLPPSDVNEESGFPTSPEALESLFSSLVIVYHTIYANSSDKTQAANRNIIFSLLNRCSSGQIIALDSTEASICCLRSLLKLAISSDYHLGCFILTDMIKGFWVSSQDCGEQYSQILFLFSQACTSILSKNYTGPSTYNVRHSIWSVIKSKLNVESSLKSSERIIKSMFHVIFSIYVNVSPQDFLHKTHDPNDPHSEISAIHHILSEAGKYIEFATLHLITREYLITTILELLVDSDINTRIIPSITAISCGIPIDQSKDLMSRILPAFFKYLVETPRSTGSEELKELISALQTLFPQPFYKPLLTCAASDKDHVILNQLNIIYAICSAIGKLQYFCKDPEMITITLLGTVTSKNSTDIWGNVKLGQLVALVEVINVLSQARIKGEEDGKSFRIARSFAEALEPRLSVFLKAREQHVLVPIAQRQLVATLFLEIRLLTKSPKHAGYVGRMVAWASCLPGTKCSLDQPEGNPFIDTKQESNMVSVTDIIVREAIETITAVQTVYKELEQELCESHPNDEKMTITSISKLNVIAHVRNCSIIINSALTLGLPMLCVLVVLCEKISDDDINSLFSLLWYCFLEFKRTEILRPVSFLILYCAERQSRCVDPVSADLESNHSIKRQKTISKLSLLFGIRTSIMAQRFGAKLQSRPFAPPAISVHTIVPTDIGSSEYTWSSALNELSETQKAGAHLPLEVKKALVQLGWENGSSQRSTTEREMFPMSSVPSHSINVDQIQLKNESKGAPMLHMSAMESKRPHKGARHRTVLGPHIVRKMIQATFLVHDQDTFVSNAAAQMAYALTRDDVNFSTRTILADLSGSYSDQQLSVQAFYHLSLIRSPVPFSFAYFALNHMIGLAKENFPTDETKVNLQNCSLLIPSIARYSAHVPEFTLREVRKNKLEYLVFPTGSFAFENIKPKQTSRFPKMEEAPDFKILSLPRHLLQLCTIRAAQNLLLTYHLTKNPHDAYAVRGLINKFHLPIEPVDVNNNKLPQFIVDSLLRNDKVDRYEQELLSASLQLARTWLLVCTRIVFGLSRFFHDAKELNRLLEGVATITYVHGDDLSVVSHTVHLCMLCSNRFKRIFSSSAEGFNFFIPILFRCFVEAKGNVAIRESIIYCFSRLYFVHEETFVFHLFASLRPMFFRPACTAEILREMIDGLALILFGLSRPQQITSDLAGVFGIISQEEKDVAVMDMNERPQNFFGKSKDGSGIENLRPLWMFDRPKLFPIEDSLKLLFTTIAYNPNSSGSQNFLSYFAHLVPFFWESGDSCRTILHDCIEALVDIYSKGPGVKTRDEFTTFAESRASQLLDHGIDGSFKPNITQSQTYWNSGRELLILLIERYTTCEGKLRLNTWRRITEILKTLLKDGTYNVVLSKKFYLSLIEVMVGHHASNNHKHIKTAINDLAQLFETYITCPVFTSLLDAWLESSLFDSFGGGSKKSFEEIVVKRFVKPAIEECAKAAWGNRLSPIRDSTVRLTAKLIERQDLIIVDTFVKQEPSARYFSSFFIPVCLNIDTGYNNAPLLEHLQHATAALTVMDQETDVSTDKESPIWLRLIEYIMSVGDNNYWSTNRGKGNDDIDGRLARKWWTICFAIHALKIIIIRGYGDGNFYSNTGLWNSMSHWLKRVLRDGDSAFVAQATSPRHSFTDVLQSTDATLNSAPLSPPPHIRVIDHTLWSILEFVITQKKLPLSDLMLDFTRDKLSVANTLSSFPEKSDSVQQQNRQDTQYLSTAKYNAKDHEQRNTKSKSQKTKRTSFQKFAKHYADFVQISNTIDITTIPSGLESNSMWSVHSGVGSNSDRSASVSPSPSLASPIKYSRIQHLGLSSETFATRNSKETMTRNVPSSVDVSRADSPTLVHSDTLRIRTVQRVRNIMIMMHMQPVWHGCLGAYDTSSELEETARLELTHRWLPTESLHKTVLEISGLMKDYEMLDV